MTGSAGAAGRRAGAAGAAVKATLVRRESVIRTGEMSLTSTDLATVRAEVDRLLAAVGGTVDNEDTTNGRAGEIERSVLVLRVPVGRFDAPRPPPVKKPRHR